MKKNYIALGLMSGTSGDGVDASVIESDGQNSYRVHLDKYFKYNSDIYESIHILKDRINNDPENLTKYDKELQELEKKITLFHVKAVNETLLETKLVVDFLGFHGQTILHNPTYGITKQIGNGGLLSQLTLKPVIYDFRQNDIKNGGEGAPLAPIFHDYIFKKLSAKRVIVNIGGISNISFLTSKNNSLYGFDSGPGNTLIDSWVKSKYNLNYDINGNIAESHNCIQQLLENLMMDKYFQNKFPKSTSTEYFSKDWLSKNLKFLSSDYSDGDILATLTNLTAFSIIQSIADNYEDCDEIYVCGGGAFNKTIMAEMKFAARKRFSEKIIVSTTDSLGVNPKTVESGLFAWLAMSKVSNIPLDYTKITGSNTPKTLGKIYTSK